VVPRLPVADVPVTLSDSSGHHDDFLGVLGDLGGVRT
jgi:hypothetical protein